MISIIMAAFIDTFTKADWLLEAIDSVRQQTLKEWELIIIDDMSSQFPELPQDERIRYFKTTEQKGPAVARNTGVALAEYKAILALDADDKLATPDTLTLMYDAWAKDKKQIIYGDLQRLELSEDQWRITKVVNLPQYTFELSLNLSGIMPVTCLHSIEAHQAAGGWKREFKFGLEDVEYWIACGKAGFCGHHIGEPTLIWRRHESSRSYQLRNVNQQEQIMRDAIKAAHNDVYNGRYPMGCCGGGRGAPAQLGQIKTTPAVNPLDGVSPDQKVWIQYNGNRLAAFGVKGNFTGTVYRIDGPGTKLEVHIQDLRLFKRSGRGRDFAISVAAPKPNGEEKKAEPEIVEAIFKGTSPEVTQIERLDQKAAARGTI